MLKSGSKSIRSTVVLSFACMLICIMSTSLIGFFYSYKQEQNSEAINKANTVYGQLLPDLEAYRNSVTNYAYCVASKEAVNKQAQIMIKDYKIYNALINTYIDDRNSEDLFHMVESYVEISTERMEALDAMKYDLSHENVEISEIIYEAILKKISESSKSLSEFTMTVYKHNADKAQQYQHVTVLFNIVILGVFIYIAHGIWAKVLSPIILISNEIKKYEPSCKLSDFGDSIHISDENEIGSLFTAVKALVHR